MVNHPIHVQVFYADDTEVIDNLSAVLMSEIVPAPRNTLMHSGNRLAMFAPFWRALGEFGVCALNLRKSFLFWARPTQMLFQSFFRVPIRFIHWLCCFAQVMEVAQLMGHALRKAACTALRRAC